jgi:mono/diheme cytochrome c family protein
LVEKIETILKEQCGSPRQIKLPGSPKVSAQHLRLGYEVYTQRCVQCHGVSGDGAGPAAELLRPRPRDFRKGIFKFTSTPQGFKPRREDIIYTLRRGITGTSMPQFDLLPKSEIEAVTDYVLALTHRGELEAVLTAEADAAQELPDDFLPQAIDDVLTPWKEAETQAVQQLSPQPRFTAERIEEGRKAFLSIGCSQCHGEDGRGWSKDNLSTDVWGHPTRAADLTSGMLHGGSKPIDIYRRIVVGVNGTPMPSFQQTLDSQPETIWNLVAFVLHVSNGRRDGSIPDPGPFSSTMVEKAERTRSSASNPDGPAEPAAK